jgi:thiosulfate dehydrogenase (quinone) large subunit
MWWEAGWHKLLDPKWMGTGEALLNYWQKGLQMTPKPAISYDWYRNFIQYLVNVEAHGWFSRVIIFGELLVAVGLLLGAFVGIAAFFGGFDELEFHHGNLCRLAVTTGFYSFQNILCTSFADCID